MSNFITKDELAKIAISKNLIKEYKSSNSERTVYLNDGTEFQIYLKNPYQTHLGVKISVNNKSIGNMLVLRPGQSFWLDRFVNENRKFLFNTYEIENTAEMKYATNNNGKVKIEFYHEKEVTPYISIYPSYRNTEWTYNTDTLSDISTITYDCWQNDLNSNLNNCNTSTCYFSTSTTGEVPRGISTASSATALRYESDTTASRKKGITKQEIGATIETGRVEKGGVSRQEFDYCDINFDYYAFKTENILILPLSQKQIHAEETRRRYCSQCGKKVNPKDKFCSNCGTKLN